MSTVLGFDFGTKKIGIAVGQTVTKTASPLIILPTKQGEPDWQEIQKIIHDWKPHVLVVGRPLNMDGTTQPITAAAEHFAKELELRYGLAVEFIDERLSSIEARANVFEKGGYKALKKKSIDDVAAQIILQDWLEGQEAS
jgi:putative Holliday junction resolvase